MPYGPSPGTVPLIVKGTLLPRSSRARLEPWGHEGKRETSIKSIKSATRALKDPNVIGCV